MYKQNKSENDSKQPPDSHMSQEALAYLNSLKEASKAIHEGKPEIQKSVPGGSVAGRKWSEPTSSRKSSIFPERKGSQLDQRPQRRASISSVVSDIWERKKKLSEDTTLSEMNIHEADELSDIFSDLDLTVSDVSGTEGRSSDKLEDTAAAAAATSPATKGSKPSRQKQSLTEPSSRTPHAKDAQKSPGKKKSVDKEKTATTVDELASGHPAPGTIGRKSIPGLSAAHSRAIQKSIEKSIFGTSTRPNTSNNPPKGRRSQSTSRESSAQSMTYLQLTTKDSEHFPKFSGTSSAEQVGAMKQSPFRRVSIIVSGSSSPSAINSAESVVEEVPELIDDQENNVPNYSADSFEETTSAESPSTASSKIPEPPKKPTAKDDLKKSETKPLKSSSIRRDRSSSESSGSISRTITPPAPERPAETKTIPRSKVIQESEFEGSMASSSSNETSSSSTVTTESRRSRDDEEPEKYGRRGSKSSEGKRRKHESQEDIIRNRRLKKLDSKGRPRSESPELAEIRIQKRERRTGSYSLSSQSSSRRSRDRHGRSHARSSSRSSTSKSSFTSSDFRNQDSELEQFDSFRQYSSKYANLLADFEKLLKKFTDKSRKPESEMDRREYVSNAAVQTVDLEPDNRLSPTFTPLLLKDIEENMKAMDEREAVSAVIQTHVELIKKQAWREKRVLEEWDSAISDLEQRCQVVTFDRLKLLLHGNDYVDF